MPIGNIVLANRRNLSHICGMPAKPLSESRKARILSRVRSRALNPDGTFKLGAQSRIAEYLGCSRQTVRKSLLNEDGWKFSEKRMLLLEAMITEGFGLDAKRPGPTVEAVLAK